MKSKIRSERGFARFVLAVLLICVMAVPQSVIAASFKVPDGKILTTLKEYDIAPGITEKHIVTVDKDGSNQNKSYAAIIDPSVSSVGFLASYKNYDSSGNWGMQTVRDQANAAAAKTGKKIVFGINGDYFNMNTGAPLGALVMDGKIVHERNNEPYFAVLKDGTVAIRDASVALDDVKEAVSGPLYLVKNGQIEAGIKNDTGANPRCAVGITEEGKVIFFTNDGRQAPMSVGMGLGEVAEFMKNMGCVDALYLDGGGSATFASRAEGDSGLTVKNSPSDGQERQVSSAILVYSDAKSTGEFDHAVISPDSEVYTPGSSAEFTAKGVDSSGSVVDLPSDGTFSLADNSMGSIDAAGKFKSSGKTGEVVVRYNSGGKVCGKATIEIRKPDSIYFINEEVALAHDKESDLGLTVKYKNRDIHYNDDDFEWTTSNDKIGTFTGNMFRSSDGKTTVDGTVTCRYKDSDVQGSLKVIVGMEPAVVMDFEDYTDADGTVTSAKDYWTFNRATFDASGGTITGVWDINGNNLNNTPNSKLLYGSYVGNVAVQNGLSNRGGNESAEIVSKDDGYPVRFGDHSLKLNYDFTNNNGSTDEAVSIITDGACLGFSTATEQISGSPTAVGMYVYAPEGTANLWMRIRVKDGNGTVQTLNFEPAKSEDGLSGIHWTGWKYVEASLEKLQGPFSLIGGETIRPMYLKGYGNKTNEGDDLPKSQCKGSIYIDNLQFVYGSNSADTDNPKFGDVRANGSILTEDGVIKSNIINAEAEVFDVENRNTQGIEPASAAVYIDGRKVTGDNFKYADNRLNVYDYKLSNGEQSIKFVIQDKAGNEAVKVVDFTVDGDTVEIPSMKSVYESEFAVLGEYASIAVKCEDVKNVNSLTAAIKLGKNFSKYKVEYGEGYEEAAAPAYNARTNSVDISAKKKSGADVTGKGVVARVSILIPDTITKGDKLEYSVTSGKYTVVGAEGNEVEGSFSTKTKKLEIKAKYNIKADRMIEGFDAAIYVYDIDDKAVSDIDIYTADGEKVGTTDKSGVLTTSKFKTAQDVKLYAQDADGNRSFVYTTKCYPAGGSADGKPQFVTLNAVKKSDTQKKITWMSTPGVSEKKATARIAAKSEYDKNKEDAFKEYEGTCKLTTFDTKVAYSNRVDVQELHPDCEYVYQVGDGEKWSDVQSFTTTYNGQNTSLLIVGDTQASSETGKQQIRDVLDSALKNSATYDTVIQTGDFVESGNSYSDWNDILGAFENEAFKSTDMIHVIGNHETYGDDGTIAKNIFGHDDIDHYSVDYGNVYIAVLGYASAEDKAKENAEWLEKDASESDAIWKIVVMHQPPYGTNATDNSTDNVHKYLPAACDKAGIDFVFSGHDHSFARTQPMVNGQVDADGTVYYICGSTGEKSYSVTPRDEYNFVVANRDFEGLYITADTTASHFKVTAYNKDGSIYDQYEKTKEICKNSLHEYEITEDNHLVCLNCGSSKRVTRDFVGVVYDQKTGVARFIKDGDFETSKWIANNEKTYYLDDKGYAVTGVNWIDGHKYTFNDKGEFVKGSFEDVKVKNPSTGKTEKITRYYTAGGEYAVKWHEIDGKMYYFKKTTSFEVYDDGKMFIGDGVTPTKVVTTTYKDTYFVFNKDGSLEVGAFVKDVDADGNSFIRYFWGDEYVTGEFDIQGFTYTFDGNGYMQTKDINDCDFNKVPKSAKYTGKAVKPDVDIKDGKQTLKAGINYTIKYVNNTKIGTAKIIIEGNPERGYTGTKTIKFNIANTVINSSGNRIYGATRYDTTIDVADKLKAKLKVEQFDTAVVACGDDFADALAGSYLAKVNDAPMLVVGDDEESQSKIRGYIGDNIKEGGKVYILGGEGAVSKKFESSLDDVTVKRLGGQDRYETNILILKEAKVSNEDVLVCSGANYADALSASAAGLPIMLIGNDMTDVQKNYIKTIKTDKYYIIGGTGVISKKTAYSLKKYGKTDRIWGVDRYETSAALADEFFTDSKTVILAYGNNFPDGLSGAPLALAYKAPLLLVSSSSTSAAEEYAAANSIKNVITLGGPALISDNAVNKIINAN